MAECLIIAGSPRKNGNSDVLAGWAAEIAGNQGYQTKVVYLRDLKFRACIACGACEKDGFCHVRDDLQSLFPMILSAERIIVTAPIYFQSLGGLVKSMIDRMQCFWSAHYLLKRNIIDDPDLRARRKFYAFLCSATDLNDTFSCAEKTLEIFARTVEAHYAGISCFPSVDAKGAIAADPKGYEKAQVGLKEFFSRP